MATFHQAQLDPFSLNGSGAVIGDTSIILQSFQTIDGTNLAMTDFGSVGYGTLDPGNGALEEQISFSGVTQNSNGTATLTGVKTVLFLTPYTETSGLAKTHAGSTQFVISNTSGFYNQFPAKANDETIGGQWTFTNTPITPPAVSNASTTVKGVTKMSVAPADATSPIAVGDNDPRVPTQNENDALTGTGTPSSSNVYVTNDTLTAKIKFGGTGANGALAISSGTTTLDAAGAQYLIKNYTSISITGTAALTISNPHANGTVLILKSLGAVTITSSANPCIDMRLMGAVGGNNGTSTGVSPTGGINNAYGTVTYSASVGTLIMAMNNAGRGVQNANAPIPSKSPIVFAGAGGGDGDSHAQTGGTGGRGGGGVYIECAGALTISAVINASGAAGTAGTGSGGSGSVGSGGRGGGGYIDSTIPGCNSTSSGDGGGGGGGAAVVIIYTSLVSNTGTYTVAGGSGGGSSGGNSGTTGGNGYSLVQLNTELV